MLACLVWVPLTLISCAAAGSLYVIAIGLAALATRRGPRAIPALVVVAGLLLVGVRSGDRRDGAWRPAYPSLGLRLPHRPSGGPPQLFKYPGRPGRPSPSSIRHVPLPRWLRRGLRRIWRDNRPNVSMGPLSGRNRPTSECPERVTAFHQFHSRHFKAGPLCFS